MPGSAAQMRHPGLWVNAEGFWQRTHGRPQMAICSWPSGHGVGCDHIPHNLAHNRHNFNGDAG
ncbi:MAG: hypothetical protein FJ303_16555 [Planctomycetes bacterium]|nr:hypothetical protein [Planctomycetota bacterium]